MSSPEASPTRRHLNGVTVSPEVDAARLALLRQTERRKRETAGSAIGRVRAIAADPHVHRVAQMVTDLNTRRHDIGGRPRAYPDWCLVLFGSCIRIFGSASATARALADQVLWAEVLRSAAHLVDSSAPLPAFGPNRDHWAYFLKSRLSTEILEELLALQRDLAIERASEVGLLESAAPCPAGAYQRDHVVGIDGKVFSSPLRTLDTERADRRTGLLRPVRQDTARERYGEGGVEGIVWGTKFAIASVRSPMANHRVVLGVKHFSSMSGGGEGRVFTELDLSRRSPGIHAFAADGAWRGKHLQAVQSDTGCGVITPARRLISRNGGITIGRYSFAAQPLPWSRRRQQREAACGGHQLWAAAAPSSSRSSKATAPATSSSFTDTRPRGMSPVTRTARCGTSSMPATPSPAPTATKTMSGGSHCWPSPATRRPSSTDASTCESCPLPHPNTNASTG